MKMLDENGKFDFNKLKSFAQENSLETFLSESPHAVLVGSGLYRGWFDNKTYAQTKGRHAETILFLQTPEEKKEVAKLKMLEKHVYPLFGKVVVSEKKKNIIKIGRSAKNDIILLDKSISAKHAEIYVQMGKKKRFDIFSIKDVGSSNTTIVNGKRLGPFVEKDLKYADVISFGRFNLVLIKAKELYEKLQKK
ncbi:MAG: FHA domain-containing protein [Magnetococcales bacterium]|nr:FHA domain-containing protein [Magnetococcales bacterium]